MADSEGPHVPSGLDLSYDSWTEAHPDDPRRDTVWESIQRVLDDPDAASRSAISGPSYGAFKSYFSPVPGAYITLHWIWLGISIHFHSLRDEVFKEDWPQPRR